MCNLWEVAIIWRERKWSAFGLLLSYMDLVADRYNSFVNAHFWGVWEIFIFSWWLPSIYFHLDKVILIAWKRSFLTFVCTPFPLHRVFKDIAVLVHQANLHIALLDFGPKPSDVLQGWMIKVSKWNFPNSWQTGSHDLRKVHSNYIIQFCTRFRLEILRAALLQFALFIFLRAAFNGILGDNEKVTLAFYHYNTKQQ